MYEKSSCPIFLYLSPAWSVTTVILLNGSDLMCKVITRHCYSGKLLEKMHDVTFFYVFVGVGMVVSGNIYL
jgi:hypothetical protein